MMTEKEIRAKIAELERENWHLVFQLKVNMDYILMFKHTLEQEVKA